MRSREGGLLRAFVNSVFGGFVGAAILLLALFFSINLIISSCADSSIECIKSGGNWDAADAACVAK
jgi:hypothetical protein